MIRGVLYRDGVRADERVDPREGGDLARGDGVFWLDVEDPSDDDLAVLAGAFDLHPLVIENARDRRQRPKVELFTKYVFVVLHAASSSDRAAAVDPAALEDREIHLFAGQGFLVTLRFSPLFAMDQAVTRWEGQPERLAGGAGFALYVVLDEVVDRYLATIESFEDTADRLEDDVFGPDDAQGERVDVRERLFHLKRESVRMRRFVSPLREGVELLFDRRELMTTELEPYYRDPVDHVIRCAELLDNVRHLATSLQEIRIAQAANRMNEVMKSLTAWATIVLVPTLLSGIWGMNFRHMPELDWKYGYLVALGSIIGSAVALFAWFKWKKRWL
jgi:magnesium transporter